MKNFIYAIAAIVLCSTRLYSQDNTCNCLENLQKLIAKTEENYAGYPTKVNQSTKPLYTGLIKSLEKKALPETNPKKCFYILKDYVRFFKDKHFILVYANEQDYDNEIITYSEAYFKNKLAKKTTVAC